METIDLMKIMQSSRIRTRQILDLKGGWPVPTKTPTKKKNSTQKPNPIQIPIPVVSVLPLVEKSKEVMPEVVAEEKTAKKKRKLVIPEGTIVNFSASQIEVRGPLGALYFETKHYKDLYEPNTPNVLSNTYHKLIQNAVKGVTYGYVVKLKVKGTGYKVIKCEDGLLTVRLGHSHLSKIKIPEHIEVSFNKSQQILCTGTSKQKLAEFAARVKRMRVRTAFRAKGIFEVSEPLPNKAPGKAGRKG